MCSYRNSTYNHTRTTDATQKTNHAPRNRLNAVSHRAVTPPAVVLHFLATGGRPAAFLHLTHHLQAQPQHSRQSSSTHPHTTVRKRCVRTHPPERFCPASSQPVASVRLVMFVLVALSSALVVCERCVYISDAWRRPGGKARHHHRHRRRAFE